MYKFIILLNINVINISVMNNNKNNNETIFFSYNDSRRTFRKTALNRKITQDI